MRDLLDIRKDIDRIDRKIVRLFEERMHCSEEVAEYKKGTGKPIYDRDREQEKIEALTGEVEPEFLKKGTEELFLQLMSIGRRYQYSLLSEEDSYVRKMFKEVDKLEINRDTKVVYQGIPGAYQEQAMVQFFGENISHFTADEFKDVVVAVDEGKADYGILPIENTSAGTVSGIYDLLLNHDVCVVGEETVECNHALVGIKGTDLSKVTKVYSHPPGADAVQAIFRRDRLGSGSHKEHCRCGQKSCG